MAAAAEAADSARGFQAVLAAAQEGETALQVDNQSTPTKEMRVEDPPITAPQQLVVEVAEEQLQLGNQCPLVLAQMAGWAAPEHPAL